MTGWPIFCSECSKELNDKELLNTHGGIRVYCDNCVGDSSE